MLLRFYFLFRITTDPTAQYTYLITTHGAHIVVAGPVPRAPIITTLVVLCVLQQTVLKSTAKAKCSFEPSCLRCLDKGLKCVYEVAKTVRGDRDDRACDETPNQNPTPSAVLPLSSVSVLDTLLHSDSGQGLGQEQVEIDWDAFEISDMLTYSPKDVLPSIQEPPASALNLMDPRSPTRYFDDALIPTTFESDDQTIQVDTLSSQITQYQHLTIMSPPTDTVMRSDPQVLAWLPVADTISQYTATVVMHMLRAFPYMMLRRETLPYFIHGHWYQSSSTMESCLPEALVTCIGIAHVYAFAKSRKQNLFMADDQDGAKIVLRKGSIPRPTVPIIEAFDSSSWTYTKLFWFWKDDTTDLSNSTMVASCRKKTILQLCKLRSYTSLCE
ncbi:hypothetical protein LTR56_023678 [Elasticomyces elasticus]|nr:hypothetical protein LTR56_023678 [Elasticomyces elasticus]KAK3624955.1 hypothetical protein LTR22_023778 [Elasticomyces elasticus]KAK4908917.1 hypothetical protein LTR49_022221 [Elasticomyces elasticus]KAK5745832.1 hypothetical protein LTS12_022984 [Elasticomyces elasticus]